MNNETTFHEKLWAKIDEFVHLIYSLSRKFPREELYGVTSQIRRAALSIALNYVEGYGRGRIAVTRNFLEIAYGSLKETKYLLDFSLREAYLNEKDYKRANDISNEIGAMIWGILRRIKR